MKSLVAKSSPNTRKSSIPLKRINSEIQRVAPERIRQQVVLACAALFAVCFLLYTRALSNGFVDYDDEVYVTQNAQLKAGLTGATVRWAFTTYVGGNWHPLTWISHALDVSIFGLSAGGHHFMSILLHTLNAVLLFLLLYKATEALERSLAVALLFAFHPLNVECVAWAAERKSLLSTFFFFLALAAYGWYARRPSIQRYGLVALSFALGLMAKPMVITLPCVLWLVDFWPLRRVNGQADHASQGAISQRSFSFLLVEKAPLFAFVVASAVMTLIAQGESHAIMPLGAVPLSWRLANSVLAYSLYLIKAIWPVRLAAFYPIAPLQFWHILASFLFLAGVTFWAWRERKRHTYLLVGWLWYLGTMVPVIGLVQVGSQAMADRYAYIPLIGIFIMVVWGLADALDALSCPLQWRAVGSCAILLVLAALTTRQLGYWQNELQLWRHTAEVTTSNLVAEDNLGLALMDLHEYDEAIVHFNNAVRIRADEPTPYMALVYVLRDRDPQQAIKNGRIALSLISDPKDAMKINGNLGVAYNHIGEFGRASELFQQVLREDPANSTAMLGLGYALLEQRAQKLQQDLDKRPTAEGFSQLGTTYEQATDTRRAQEAYLKALSIDPRLSSAQQGMERLAKPAQ